MQDSLQDELKAFEKELSILLVRFMKICDKVEQQGGAPTPVPQAAPVAPAAPSSPRPRPIDLRAYA